MAHFKLTPVDTRLHGIEFDAVSAGSVLDVAVRSMLGETDVYRDGPYQCTVSHGGGRVWTIAQRKMALHRSGKTVNQARCETPRALPIAPYSRQPVMA